MSCMLKILQLLASFTTNFILASKVVSTTALVFPDEDGVRPSHHCPWHGRSSYGEGTIVEQVCTRILDCRCCHGGGIYSAGQCHSSWLATTWLHRCLCFTGMPAVQICLLLKMYGAPWRGKSDNDDHRMLILLKHFIQQERTWMFSSQTGTWNFDKDAFHQTCLSALDCVYERKLVIKNYMCVLVW